jgi:tRNA C32,U32 (ribose-2'-O)-methylase TrmJ
MGNMTSGKKVDNNISDDRVHDLARQLGEELGEQGVDNPTNRNKLELANQWFTEKRINNHELRALRKLLGAVKP